ncbi:hypothetical protein K458DRAFT_204917 [Lentithecium fluviatile CBS 122367]|uniref:Uncharacterized protein n=1 Tax=Lentithecium fluviatile CBS 122367 TaxID=1168545 RepID=A0A6G1J9R4_9PLEO|nr:hypothetical protein K458DRAFT_204917 [Lentithecium fluviatile CBS 122367]
MRLLGVDGLATWNILRTFGDHVLHMGTLGQRSIRCAMLSREADMKQRHDFFKAGSTPVTEGLSRAMDSRISKMCYWCPPTICTPRLSMYTIFTPMWNGSIVLRRRRCYAEWYCDFPPELIDLLNSTGLTLWISFLHG